jgi:Major Facilitator Superfamily
MTRPTVDPLSSPDPLKAGGRGKPTGITFVDDLVDVSHTSTSSIPDDDDIAEEMDYGTLRPPPSPGRDDDSDDATGGPHVRQHSTPTKPSGGSRTMRGREVVSGPLAGAASSRGAEAASSSSKSPEKIRLPSPFTRTRAGSASARRTADDSAFTQEDESRDESTGDPDETSHTISRSGLRPSSADRRGSNAGNGGAGSISFKRRAGARAAGRNARQRDSVAFTENPNRSSLFSNLRVPFRRVKTASVHQQQGGNDDSRFSEEFLNELRNGGGGGGDDSKPYIPPLIPQVKADPYTTPIPTLPFVVLCITIFSEFCAAGVAGPFLFFMIEDFDVGGEAEVGFWAGILASAFFFAQFLTSMLWASVADRHGRRSVLLVSLVGNSISMFLFGTAKNLPTALSIRLAQGLFNGAVGVAKGAVRDLTDETNEGRAYAVMGFCWGMGGIIG